MLTRLAYSSIARSNLSKTDLEDIIQACQKHNIEEDITGVLVYNGESFIQILEGAEKALDHLMGIITQDPRHSEVEVLMKTEIQSRAFSKWSMGFLLLNDLDLDHMVGLSTYEEILESMTESWEKQDTFIKSCIRVLEDQMPDA